MPRIVFSAEVEADLAEDTPFVMSGGDYRIILGGFTVIVLNGTGQLSWTPTRYDDDGDAA